ncbi:UNVERIFIED_CONTAM: hypothetical protein HHA_268320 [Hammondia hammondi]|eukprot:XP_008882235.1 hypothetical protein HHA_268320 [Hammondia hammondi]
MKLLRFGCHAAVSRRLSGLDRMVVKCRAELELGKQKFLLVIGNKRAKGSALRRRSSDRKIRSSDFLPHTGGAGRGAPGCTYTPAVAAAGASFVEAASGLFPSPVSFSCSRSKQRTAAGGVTPSKNKQSWSLSSSCGPECVCTPDTREMSAPLHGLPPISFSVPRLPSNSRQKRAREPQRGSVVHIRDALSPRSAYYSTAAGGLFPRRSPRLLSRSTDSSRAAPVSRTPREDVVFGVETPLSLSSPGESVRLRRSPARQRDTCVPGEAMPCDAKQRNMRFQRNRRRMRTRTPCVPHLPAFSGCPEGRCLGFSSVALSSCSVPFPRSPRPSLRATASCTPQPGFVLSSSFLAQLAFSSCGHITESVFPSLSSALASPLASSAPDGPMWSLLRRCPSSFQYRSLSSSSLPSFLSSSLLLSPSFLASSSPSLSRTFVSVSASPSSESPFSSASVGEEVQERLSVLEAPADRARASAVAAPLLSSPLEAIEAFMSEEVHHLLKARSSPSSPSPLLPSSSASAASLETECSVFVCRDGDTLDATLRFETASWAVAAVLASRTDGRRAQLRNSQSFFWIHFASHVEAGLLPLTRILLFSSRKPHSLRPRVPAASAALSSPGASEGPPQKVSSGAAGLSAGVRRPRATNGGGGPDASRALSAEREGEEAILEGAALHADSPRHEGMGGALELDSEVDEVWEEVCFRLAVLGRLLGLCRGRENFRCAASPPPVSSALLGPAPSDAAGAASLFPDVSGVREALRRDQHSAAKRAVLSRLLSEVDCLYTRHLPLFASRVNPLFRRVCESLRVLSAAQEASQEAAEGGRKEPSTPVMRETLFQPLSVDSVVAPSRKERLRLQSAGHRAVETLEVVRLLSFLVRCLRSLPHQGGGESPPPHRRAEAEPRGESHGALFRAPRLISFLRRHIAGVARVALVGCLPPASRSAAACLALLDKRGQVGAQATERQSFSGHSEGERHEASSSGSGDVLRGVRSDTGEATHASGDSRQAEERRLDQDSGVAVNVRTEGSFQRSPSTRETAARSSATVLRGREPETTETKEKREEKGEEEGDEVKQTKDEGKLEAEDVTSDRREKKVVAVSVVSGCEQMVRQERLSLAIRKAWGRRRFACITLQDATNNLNSAMDLCRQDARVCLLHCEKLLWCLERLGEAEARSPDVKVETGELPVDRELPADLLQVLADLLDCKLDKQRDRDRRWSLAARRREEEAPPAPEALPLGTGAVETPAGEGGDTCPLETRVKALGRRRRRRLVRPERAGGPEAQNGDTSSPRAPEALNAAGRETERIEVAEGASESQESSSGGEAPTVTLDGASRERSSESVGVIEGALEFDDIEEEEESFLLLHNMLDRHNPYAFPRLLASANDVGDELWSISAVALEEREKQHQFAEEGALFPFYPARLAGPSSLERNQCGAGEAGVCAPAPPFAFLVDKRARFRELEKEQQRIAQLLAGARGGANSSLSGVCAPRVGDSHEWWVVGGNVRPVPRSFEATTPAPAPPESRKQAPGATTGGGANARAALSADPSRESFALRGPRVEDWGDSETRRSAKQPHVDVFRAARLAELEQATKDALRALVVSCCFPPGRRPSARAFQTTLLAAIGAQSAARAPEALLGQQVWEEGLSCVWPQIHGLAGLLKTWQDSGPVFFTAVSVSTPCGAVADTPGAPRADTVGEGPMWGDALCKVEGSRGSRCDTRGAEGGGSGVRGSASSQKDVKWFVSANTCRTSGAQEKVPETFLINRQREGGVPLSVYSVERRYWGVGDRRDSSEWQVSEVLVLLRKLQRAASKLTGALERQTVHARLLLPQIVASREAESLLLTVVQGLAAALGEETYPRLDRLSVSQVASTAGSDDLRLVQDPALVPEKTARLEKETELESWEPRHSRAMLLHATTGAVYGSLSRGWQWLVVQRLGKRVIPRGSSDIETRQRHKETKAGLLSIQHLRGSPPPSFVSPGVSPLALLVPPRPRRVESKGPLSAALLPTASGAPVLLEPHPQFLRELGRRLKPAQGRMEGWLTERRKLQDKDEGLWLRRIDKLHSLLTMTLKAPRGTGGVSENVR